MSYLQKSNAEDPELLAERGALSVVKMKATAFTLLLDDRGAIKPVVQKNIVGFHI